MRKVAGCVAVDFINLNSFVDIFSRKRNDMKQLFNENLFLQKTFHGMLLTFVCGFCIERVECLKKNQLWWARRIFTEEP